MNIIFRAALFRRVGDDPRASGLGLYEAAVIFSRRISPRLLLLVVALATLARVTVGGFTGWDLALMAGMVALQPMTEWVIHVGVLHWRPRKLGPWKADSHLSWAHRKHHARPNDEKFWFIPVRSGLVGLGLVGLVGWWALPTVGLWLTWMVVSQAITLVYEWTHFLCHSAYRPQGSAYRRIWRYHRLHHFKNENYWLGVTMHLGDWLLGTLPDAQDVPTSPTCRDLHG